MSTRDEAWPEGTPSWVDLMVPDREAARAFYGGLFGWDFTEGGPETGHYLQGHFGGRPIAGIGEAPPDEPTVAAAWTTYFAVQDADDVARRITDAGGTIMMAPMAIDPFGRMAIASDPAGGVFGLWQGGDHIGARIVNEPGTLTWSEALSTDFESAKNFYATVFGFAFDDLSGPEFDYGVLQLDGRTVAGISSASDELDSLTSHWLAYFAVEDVDASTVRAVDLGATVLGEPRDSTYGRMAVLTGPAGERFAIIALAPGDSEAQPAE